MSRKNVTTEDLAITVKKGFDETAKRRDLEELKSGMNSRMGHIEEKLDNIEKLILKQHSFKIQDLEKRIKRMEDLFAMK